MTNKALIIGDHADTAKFISTLLAIEGFIVIIAVDGQKGIEKARTERPDIIILDLALPGIDAFEVCKRLKTEAITADIPVIIVSVKGEAENIKRKIEVGYADYIVKPFENDLFIERVKRQLRSK